VVVAAATREAVRGEVVRLVHRGLGVPDYARAVSRILARAGGGSRGELVARLFFDHDAPRLGGATGGS
jgi:hypothetical protein